jgi:hypothetical protein
MPSLRVSFTEMKGFAISSMLNSERMGPGDEEARQTAGPLLVDVVVTGHALLTVRAGCRGNRRRVRVGWVPPGEVTAVA